MKLPNAFRILTVALLAAVQVGSRESAIGAEPITPPPPSGGDTRKPLPLLAHMAEHQRANMRDHLAAIQEILAALSANDFPGVERAASRIGYSEQMGRMCNHMGTGAPGFSGIALNFHRTADTIGVAAKQRDADATLKAVSATLQTCVVCHATYRQEIVDGTKWNELTKAIR